MIIEPAATCQPLSTAKMPARPLRFLFPCAKRQPATPIRKPPFGPQQRQFDSIKRSARRCSPLATPWIKVNNRKRADFACRSAFRARESCAPEPEDLPPASGEELRPLLRPRITVRPAPSSPEPAIRIKMKTLPNHQKMTGFGWLNRGGWRTEAFIDRRWSRRALILEGRRSAPGLCNEGGRGKFCDRSPLMEGWLTTTKQDIDAALARLAEAFPQTFVLVRRAARPLSGAG